jgi:uncharacterized protein YndB with AHSA1/START domain
MLTHARPHSGKRMQMRTVSGATPWSRAQVVEYDPPHRFSHTHRFTQHDDPVCTVVYDLKPVAGGVEVTLTVVDIPVGTATAKSMQTGRHVHPREPQVDRRDRPAAVRHAHDVRDVRQDGVRPPAKTRRRTGRYEKCRRIPAGDRRVRAARFPPPERFIEKTALIPAPVDAVWSVDHARGHHLVLRARREGRARPDGRSRSGSTPTRRRA